MTLIALNTYIIAPFPTTLEDVRVKFDSSRSASRQFNINWEIPKIGEKVEGYVSSLWMLPDIS